MALLPQASFRSNRCHHQAGFWRAAAHELDDVARLPQDFSAMGEATYAHIDIDLGADTVAALASRHHQRPMPIFSALFAALELMLSRYAGGSVVVATPPFLHLRRPEKTGVALPIRPARCPAASCLRSALDDAASRLKAAVARQDFRQAQAGNAGTVSDFGDDTEVLLSAEGLHVQEWMGQPAVVHARWGGLSRPAHMAIRYRSDLLDARFVARMFATYRAVLSQLAHHEEAPISSAFDIDESDDKQRVVHYDAPPSWELPEDPFPLGRLWEIFTQATARAPHSIAIRSGPTILSYAELHQQADEMAESMQSRGLVSRHSIVALSLGRSHLLLVVLLALLRCEASFVALPRGRSPSWTRNAWTACAATHLISDGPPMETPGEVAIGHELRVRRLAPGTAAPVLGQLAIYFTSSTTGEPKGVRIPSSALINRLKWMWQCFPFQEDARILFHKPPSMVGALWEMYGGLLGGAETVIASEQDAADPARLWRLLESNAVTRLSATTTALSLLLEEAAHHRAEQLQLREVFCSAEPLSVQVTRGWKREFPRARLYNLYGATECSSNASVFDTQALAENQSRVPIGKAIANSRLYILDNAQRPLPDGAIGELCVAGLPTALGYVGGGNAHASIFVPEPKWSGFFARMVRTGDMGRVRCDGEIELLGRRDHIVKLRGMKVNLQEIENAIGGHPCVQECAVSLQLWDGDQHLVGFFVPKAPIAPQDLRSHIVKLLPAYMLPTLVQPLDALPKSAHGKLNRKALPKAARPDDTDILREGLASGVLNRTEVIRRVVGAILHIADVDADQSLLSLSDSSLSLVRIQQRIRKIFGVALDITDLFTYPTARTLAEHLGGNALRVPHGAHGRGEMRRRAAQAALPQDKKAPRFSY